jgi:7,8-dihydropterin-6-yl-methyl-4-(beta-D-ribofuranosyl)aminobenzene 5'-phosphate synthase
MRPLRFPRRLRLTVLVDDLPGSADIQAEHGLSFWIEADHFRVLFDTGHSTAALENSRRLGLDLAETDAVVISHGHDDHTGGLRGVLAECQKAHIYLHPTALRTRYSQAADGSAARTAGFPLDAGELLAARGDDVHWTKTVTHLQPAIYLTGEIPRRRPQEAPAGGFFLDADCRTPDPLLDDQALAFETGDGLVVVLGCSHSGVLNTLNRALDASRSGKLRAIVGGMHLATAQPQAIARLADGIEKLDPQLICPCHCTGDAARHYLEGRFPDAFREMHTGSTLMLNGDS